MLKPILGVLAAMLIATATIAAPKPHVKLTGHTTQGGLILGQVPPGTKVQLDGQPVKVRKDGKFVFGFGYEAKPKARLDFTWPDGSTYQKTIKVKQRKFKTQYIHGLPPKEVTPPPDVLAWIARDRKLVHEARTITSDLGNWTGHFIWPAKGKITGVYGSRRMLNGKPRWPHFGLDIAGPRGTPIHAPAGGTVLLASPNFYYEGGIIIIDHGFGVSSTLFHMRKLYVKVGQHVKQGQVLGEMGAAGRATGPHVDWRINWHDVRLDPALVAPPGPPGG